ncbi:MAG: hypothetical protein HGA23_03675 [Bacteroidales bacterium]|nr:hypothetical protein [Bacteroidales bacterium]
MKKQNNFILSVYSALILIFIVSGCQQDKNEIRQAIENQLKIYPQSSLQDIYKSFFQDEYGPGHLVENVSFAREYFDLELEEMVSKGRHDAEPCGTGKHFYRVPMDLVKDGIIPEEEYFSAFLESASSFTTPDVIAWKKQWQEIVIIIEKMDLDLPNFTRDKEALNKWLDRGETMVHHSQGYNDKYDPNYRIMGKVQWERLKESFLNN